MFRVVSGEGKVGGPQEVDDGVPHGTERKRKKAETSRPTEGRANCAVDSSAADKGAAGRRVSPEVEEIGERPHETPEQKDVRKLALHCRHADSDSFCQGRGRRSASPVWGRC